MSRELENEIKTYNIVALAFARGTGGSQERRCLWDLCGKPLIQWAAEATMGSKYVSRVVIGTEDMKIARVAERLGVAVIFRPLEDAIDFPRDYTGGRLKRIMPRSLIHGQEISWSGRREYLLYWLKEKERCIPDLIFSWVPDAPLARAETADRVIEAFFKDDEASMARSVYAAEPKFFIVNPSTGELVPFFIDSAQSLDRQLYPPLFKPGPFTLSGLQSKGRGKAIHVIISEEEGFHIHSKKDFELARFYMEKRLKEGGEHRSRLHREVLSN